MRRMALGLAVSLGAAAAAGPVQARAQDWADDPAAAGNPAFAASQAICRRLKPVAVPPGDAPTRAEAAALADCSSEALYYGIGRPADPRAARLCAAVETATADPQVTDYGFTGDRMLMTVYANGLGAPRDLDRATALACRSGGTPDEVDGRVRHLARLKAEGWTGADFSLCDDAASGMLWGICADHRQLIGRALRAQAFASLSSGWSVADRAAFAPLRRAEAAFSDARGQDEADQSGSGRVAAVDAAEDAAERAFAGLLGDAEAGRIAPATASEAAAADAALDAAFRGLMARAPTLVRTSTLTAAGLADAERAWLRYRDAWATFAGRRYPALSRDALLARLARDRTAQLAELPVGPR